MTVATPIQPDVTTQSAAVYKAAIDAQTAALAQTANMYAPHEAATPDMTVLVDAGRFLASAVSLVTNAQQTTATITAPVTNPRIDRVVIDAVTGVISVVAGAEAASPSAPAIPSGKLPICQVALATSTAAITNSLITDERAFMANFPALLAAANTWTADQTISTTDPQLILIETDATADNKRWDLRASGEALSLRAVNDADSVATDIFTVQRTGTTVDSLTIPCTFASTKAAASGFSRVTPNMCRIDTDFTAATVSLIRNTITLVTGPTGCTGLILLLQNHAESANATGDRYSTTFVYSDSGATIPLAVNNCAAREQAAVTAGNVLVSSSVEVHVQTDASGQVWLKFSDDAADNGTASYTIVGYYD